MRRARGGRDAHPLRRVRAPPTPAPARAGTRLKVEGRQTNVCKRSTKQWAALAGWEREAGWAQRPACHSPASHCRASASLLRRGRVRASGGAHTCPSVPSEAVTLRGLPPFSCGSTGAAMSTATEALASGSAMAAGWVGGEGGSSCLSVPPVSGPCVPQKKYPDDRQGTQLEAQTRVGTCAASLKSTGSATRGSLYEFCASKCNRVHSMSRCSSRSPGTTDVPTATIVVRPLVSLANTSPNRFVYYSAVPQLFRTHTTRELPRLARASLYCQRDRPLAWALSSVRA